MTTEAPEHDFYAQTEYEADGETDIFSIPFEYLLRDAINVFVDGEETSDFEFISEFQIKLEDTPEEGDIVQISRDTPLERQVDFHNASLLDDDILNENSLQMLHIVQEAYDQMTATITRGPEYNWDAQEVKISNVGDPTDPMDALNLRTADTILQDAQQAADDAETAKDAAEDYADSAEQDAIDAENALSDLEDIENDVIQHKEKAKDWANHPEDDPVEGGEYSAYHWSKKAEQVVLDAEEDEHGNELHTDDFVNQDQLTNTAQNTEDNANDYTDTEINNLEDDLQGDTESSIEDVETDLIAHENEDAENDNVHNVKDYVDSELDDLDLPEETFNSFDWTVSNDGDSQTWEINEEDNEIQVHGGIGITATSLAGVDPPPSLSINLQANGHDNSHHSEDYLPMSHKGRMRYITERIGDFGTAETGKNYFMVKNIIVPNNHELVLKQVTGHIGESDMKVEINTQVADEEYEVNPDYLTHDSNYISEKPDQVLVENMSGEEIDPWVDIYLFNDGDEPTDDLHEHGSVGLLVDVRPL